MHTHIMCIYIYIDIHVYIIYIYNVSIYIYKKDEATAMEACVVAVQEQISVLILALWWHRKDGWHVLMVAVT